MWISAVSRQRSSRTTIEREPGRRLRGRYRLPSSAGVGRRPMIHRDGSRSRTGCLCGPDRKGATSSWSAGRPMLPTGSPTPSPLNARPDPESSPVRCARPRSSPSLLSRVGCAVLGRQGAAQRDAIGPGRGTRVRRPGQDRGRRLRALPPPWDQDLCPSQHRGGLKDVDRPPVVVTPGLPRGGRGVPCRRLDPERASRARTARH